MTPITPAQLQALRIAAHWLEPLNAAMFRFSINTPQRVAAFIGQCAHESANFTALSENLNYSAERMAAIWPLRFAVQEPDPKRPGKTKPKKDAAGKNIPTALALTLHRKPEMIASSVYANRMGNGPEASGDGWKYRGRGLIQLTGKDNYRLASDSLRVDLVANPDAVTQPDMAALTAAWYWNKRGLNALADRGHNKTISRRINGGTHGLDDRLQRTATALALLTPPAGQDASRALA
jgi:putative chitinase